MSLRPFFVLGFACALGCSSTTSGTGTGTSGGVDGGDPGVTYNDLVVFTTKASSGGDLGGLAGADQKCTTYANAAGLKGKFRAWLSDTSTDAISRVPEGGPWRTLDKSGKQAAVAFADHDAWLGYPEVAIQNTEFGKQLSDFSTSGTTTIPYTWTGTKLGGKRAGCACEDWTSSANFVTCADASYGGGIGSRGAGPANEDWTAFGDNPCDAPAALLCFQLP